MLPHSGSYPPIVTLQAYIVTISKANSVPSTYADRFAEEAPNHGMVRYFKTTWENAYVQNDLLHTFSGIREAVEAGFGRTLMGITPTTDAAATRRGIKYGGKLYINLAGDTSFSIDSHLIALVPTPKNLIWRILVQPVGLKEATKIKEQSGLIPD